MHNIQYFTFPALVLFSFSFLPTHVWYPVITECHRGCNFKGNTVWEITACFLSTLFLLPDPNTQILYACDSCGDKFLDASSLAQHVRIHTAQALVMFQADSDFYQYTTATAAEGDSATTWQPTTEQVIQEELIFRAPEGEGEAEGGMVGETQAREEESGAVIHVEGREAGEVETHTELPAEGRDEAAAEVEEEQEEAMECESEA